MSQKKVMLVVDNRDKPEESCAGLRAALSNDLRGSGFKATEVDMDQDHQSVNLHELMWLSQLQRRVENLEDKVKELETHKPTFLKKKQRRKASEIDRSFQCPHEDCARIYGSDTSLKNHLKIKHQEALPL